MDLHVKWHVDSASLGRISSDVDASKEIGIVLFDGFALSEAATIIEVFKSANALAESNRAGAPLYDVRLLSGSGGGIASSSSVFVWTESVHARRSFHGIFVIGGEGVQCALRDKDLLHWLRYTYSGTSANFLMHGERVLDDAQRAHRHGDGRVYGEPLRDAKRGRPDDDAAASPLRIALNLVRSDLGAQVARQISDWVASPIEPQLVPFATTKNGPPISDKIQAAVQWLHANGARPIAIDQAAQVATMSERNFLRRFKMEVGATPSDYLLHVRLEMSCRMLVKTDLPVDKIARRCGIGCGGRLSKLFRKHFATTPSEYRDGKRGAAHNVLVKPQVIRLFQDQIKT